MFSDNNEIRELLRIFGELGDIGAAGAVLDWDQQTYMPPKGASARAKQLATLAGIYHERITRPETGEAISRAEEKVNTEYDRALVREAGRAYERATKLPNQLVRDLSEATARGFISWREAKDKDSWKIFQPDLEKILQLKIEAARFLVKDGQTIYDVMLDEHEQGLTEDTVSRVFGEIRQGLTDLAKDLTAKTAGADKIMLGKSFETERQWSFGMKILEEMGYDLQAGRQDKSAHPFTTMFSTGDVRITTWEDGSDLRPMLFATIHEAGHALYEQGVDPGLDRTPLSGGMGLAMHESQSRMWENMVGRSPEFWKKYYPDLKKTFPSELSVVTAEQFVKAVNTVCPSPVRVEADEVTYGLHIIVRFEIEKDLIRGKIGVADLPNIWREKMQNLLGLTPKSDREGVLQDVHWSYGSFGYFPTYLLGTMIAAQLWSTIRKQLPIEQEIEQGNLRVLREWLRENIHRHGSVYLTNELLTRVTGENLGAAYYLDYLKDKFDNLYQ